MAKIKAEGFGPEAHGFDPTAHTKMVTYILSVKADANRASCRLHRIVRNSLDHSPIQRDPQVGSARGTPTGDALREWLARLTRNSIRARSLDTAQLQREGIRAGSSWPRGPLLVARDKGFGLILRTSGKG